MSFAYKIYDKHSLYNGTFTIHPWADVFTIMDIKKEDKIWFWEEGFHGAVITSPDFSKPN